MKNQKSRAVTLQVKNELNLDFESAMYPESGDPQRFRRPPGHPLNAACEEQMFALFRECKGDDQYNSVYNSVKPELHGAPYATA